MDQPSSTESNAITLRIRFKSASLEEFISRYGVDVSPGGIFIRTRQPVEVGTTLQFDFTLGDGSSLLAGLGTVAWVRENDPARANSMPGMGLRFDKLTPESQQAHQTILAEKARKEGKPQGTPCPPTGFVAPASRPSPAPEPVTVAGAAPVQPEELAKPAPANFAQTLPAPAAALAAGLQESASDADDFESGGKTEISAQPIDYYVREAEAAQKSAIEAASAVPEDFAPSAPLDGWNTDAHATGETGAPPAPEEVAVPDAQMDVADEAVPQPVLTGSGERRISAKQSFTSLLDLGGTAETDDESQAPFVDAMADLSSGVPIEEASSEKTEEVSLSPAKTAEQVVDAIDLGTASPEEEVEEVPSLAEVESKLTKPKRSSPLVVGAVVFAGAAAFAVVYLIQARPWEQSADVEGPTVVVKKRPAVAPLPAPAPAPTVRNVVAARPAPPAAPAQKPVAPAAEEPKPAVVEEAAPKKPLAAEEKKVEKPAAAVPVAEKPAAKKPVAAVPAVEKPAAEKAEASKPAPAKPAVEKPVAAKAEPEPEASKTTPKPAAKPAAVVEKSGAAAAVEEEIFRLSFKSVPIGAEVLIDGEYFARTPCERRILDPKKSLAITLRREGYEPHERMLGSSDNWVKKGNERVLTVSATLKKVVKPATGESPAPATGGTEVKPAVGKPAPSDEAGKAKQ